MDWQEGSVRKEDKDNGKGFVPRVVLEWVDRGREIAGGEVRNQRGVLLVGSKQERHLSETSLDECVSSRHGEKTSPRTVEGSECVVCGISVDYRKYWTGIKRHDEQRTGCGNPFRRRPDCSLSVVSISLWKGKS